MADENCTHTSPLELDLNYEKNRLKTFNNNWPHPYIIPSNLAKVGFWYTGPYDQVECYFCKITINCWEIGTNEIMEHWNEAQKAQILCPLLNQNLTKNIPLEPSTELKQLLQKSKDQLFKIDRRMYAYAETPLEHMNEQRLESEYPYQSQYYEMAEILELSSYNVDPHYEILETIKGIVFETDKKPDFPKYKQISARLETFIGWPGTTNQNPQKMSEAGFFFTQKSDRVICYYCGGGLCDWQEEDDPWEQHALLYSDCVHLRAEKSSEYIKMVKQKFASNE